MPLTKPTMDVDNIQGLANRTTGQATAVKVLFDKVGADIKAYLEDHCDEADLLYATKLELADAILGEFPDGSIIDTKLSNTAGQIKERVANHLSDIVKHITGEERIAWNAKLDAEDIVNLSSKSMSRGLSTKTASFPARTGTTPNFVYTMVTITIPISSTIEEVFLNVGQGRITLFRGFNYAIKQDYSSGTVGIATIVPTNLGYGSTFTGAAGPASLVGSNSLFTTANIIVADVYISGSNIVIVAYNNSTTTYNSVSQDFEYIARG